MGSESTGFVVCADGRWMWTPWSTCRAVELSTAEVAALIGPSGPARPARRDLPALPSRWIGVVADGAIRVATPAGDVSLTGSELAALVGPPQRPTGLGAAIRGALAARRPVSPGGTRRGAVRSGPEHDGSDQGGPRRGSVQSDELMAAAANPLADRLLGQELVEAGFVTIPLLDAAGVKRLREVYRDEHGWEGTGFDPDPGNHDLAYRARVAAAVREVVEAPMRDRMPGWVPFLNSYYCKWPGSLEIHLHWDWSCVDESLGHRTYQVWIALQDVGPENGMMWMFPGSHRVDPRPRGTNLAIPVSEPFVRHDGEIRRKLVPVPLRAGEAVIFDMGLVHISSSNSTAEPRLAVVVALREAAARPAYFRRLDAATALRYDVDDRWYNETVAGDLLDAAPALVPSAVVPIDPPDLPEARLARLLAESDESPVPFA